MGVGGASHGALGCAAVRCAVVIAIASLPALAGCSAVPDILGLVTGGVVGTATVNPAAGFAAGVATSAAADEVVKDYGRSRQHAEQEEIAAAAAPLSVGGVAHWRIRHIVPLGNEHGRLLVARVFQSALTSCKEIIFSVESSGDSPSRGKLYTAALCLQSDARWHWASAEPSVSRWGFLQ
jgi:hypothetical protein